MSCGDRATLTITIAANQTAAAGAKTTHMGARGVCVRVGGRG